MSEGRVFHAPLPLSVYMDFSTQAANVDSLCAAIPQPAAEKCPDMEDEAQAMVNKYGRALLLFSKCHNAFNSGKYFDDPSLSALRKVALK